MEPLEKWISSEKEKYEGNFLQDIKEFIWKFKEESVYIWACPEYFVSDVGEIVYRIFKGKRNQATKRGLARYEVAPCAFQRSLARAGRFVNNSESVLWDLLAT
jgi:hypothetical protein